MNRIKLILVIFLSIWWTASLSQTKSKLPEVAPATTMELKDKSVSVKTSNPAIAEVFLKDGMTEDSRLKSCHITWKTDRMGRYAQYSFSFAPEAYNHLVEFFRKFKK